MLFIFSVEYMYALANVYQHSANCADEFLFLILTLVLSLLICLLTALLILSSLFIGKFLLTPAKVISYVLFCSFSPFGQFSWALVFILRHNTPSSDTVDVATCSWAKE